MPHAAVTPFAAVIRPSRLWLGWVVLAHAALVIAVISLLPMPYWLLLLGCPLTLWLSLAPTGHLPGKTSVRQIQVDATGRLFADSNLAEVLDDSFISNWLIVLNLRIAGRRYGILLLNDSTPAEFHRALRVYLRWYPLAPQPVKPRLIDLLKKHESTKHPA